MSLSEPTEGSVSENLGYEHLLAPRRGSMHGDKETLQFDSPGGKLKIDLLSAGKSELTVATGHADLKGKTKEALLIRKQGKDATFVDVLSFPDRESWKEVDASRRTPFRRVGGSSGRRRRHGTVGGEQCREQVLSACRTNDHGENGATRKDTEWAIEINRTGSIGQRELSRAG